MAESLVVMKSSEITLGSRKGLPEIALGSVPIV